MTINFFITTKTGTKSEAGFSLVELMVVVAIIAVIGAIAVPNMSPANARLKQAARELYGNMQRARMEAIKSNQNVGIVFDTVNNLYQLCQNFNSDNDCTDAGETILTTINLSSYGSDVQYAGGFATSPGGGSGPSDGVSYGNIPPSTNTMLFSSTGRPNKTGYVYLKNNKNSYYVVGTPSMAGVVVMKKWQNNAWQ